MAQMHSYRAYFLSASDDIREVAAFESTDDASACAEADFLLRQSEHAAVEVYYEWRLIGRAERAQQAA